MKIDGQEWVALLEAASAYYLGYCQDEADDEIEANGSGRWTGCGRQQRDDARALRDAIADIKAAAPQPKAEGWRPISEAPKDGTAMLAYWPPVSPLFADADSYGVTAFRDGQWRPADDTDDTEWAAPTHFQPLPTPPATEGADHE